MGDCEFCNLTPEEEKYLLYRNADWNVYLADTQDYIGSCCVVSAAHYESLSELPGPAWASLKEIINALEAMLKEVLGAAMCNWSCLMNNAYKSANPAPHVHFLVRPRYRDPIRINGQAFRDDAFGRHYAHGGQAEMDEETRMVLFERLREAIRWKPH